MQPNPGNNFTTHPGRSTRKRLPDIILRVGALFIILEPLWMLLPFAGFLYGSVMHIEALSKSPYTARLVYFVFPIHTLFPLGLMLIIIGLLVFLAAAVQIYGGKIAKKGLIRTGIYRKFRHPQYLALTIFGIGIILTWGRLLTFIAFFIMLWLYYFLAKGEEKNCREVFGREYDTYHATTYFLVPGEELLFAAARRLPSPNMPAWLRIFVSFILVVTIAVSSGLMIIKGKSLLRNSPPVIVGDYPLTDHIPAQIPLLMVKGPALQAAPSEKVRSDFMARIFAMLLTSPKIKGALKQVDLETSSTLLVFLTPGRNWYRGGHRDYRQAKLNAFIFCLKSPVAFKGDNFREFRRNWQISSLIRVEEMSADRLAAGLDPAGGKITTEPFRDRMEERIDFFLSGL
ncbi:MAG: isoprenylcysteine carboxylmethyltransferase family protein [Thermodesulfobacteriota bacterium]